MTNFAHARYALEPTQVAIDNGEERGLILRVDGRLVAVLVRLDAEYNGEHRGHWYLEAGFGPCSGIAPAPFLQIRDAMMWVAGRLGDDSASLDDVLRHLAWDA